MKLYPNWKGSLVVFGILIILLMGNFLWQVQKINKSFVEYSLTHSKVLGAVVELNIQNSLISYAGMEAVIENYLADTARFISYLNQIEPFNSYELMALANESGLAGIKIIIDSKRKQITETQEWLPLINCQNKNKLEFLPEKHLYIYTYAYQKTELSPVHDCIIIGMSTKNVEKIQKKMSVKNLLNVLNTMKGIEYVYFNKIKKNSNSLKNSSSSGKTTIIYTNDKPISETRITMGDHELIVGLKANFFSKQVKRLKKELIIFVSFLIFFGGFLSWWLYRIQQNQLEQTRNFERKMARQLEQASLGRAAATITHEMRNPLNAISMGLQRLQLENNSLDKEHLDLVSSMQEAVDRSNFVITNLQQYAHSFEINQKEVVIAKVIEPLTVLYQSQCVEYGIIVDLQLDKAITVTGDANYLAQVFENLIKNAVEAQIDGGFIKITLLQKDNNCLIYFENQCLPLKSEESKMLLEPYFTTKTYGTGLGLAISKKIIEAHSGTLVTEFKNKTFLVCITLPTICHGE